MPWIMLTRQYIYEYFFIKCQSLRRLSNQDRILENEVKKGAVVKRHQQHTEKSNKVKLDRKQKHPD